MLRYSNTTKPSAKLLANTIPSVLFFRSVITQMECYIEGCLDEIGWMCAAKKSSHGDIIVYDAFLFKQEVHSTTTEITPEGLTEFGMKLLEQENGMDLWNDIRAWGHSHVHMACFPSAQDNTQMMEFKKTGAPWFVRIIGNKKGEMQVDIYDYSANIEYHNVEWEVIESDEDEALMAQIDDIQQEADAKIALIEEEMKARNKIIKDDAKLFIDAEIKEKVTKKYAYQSNIHYGNTRGSVAGQQRLDIDDAEKKNGTSVAVGNRPSLVVVDKRTMVEESGISETSDVDIIVNVYTDYYKYFTYMQAFDIAEFDDLDELQTAIWDEGIHVQFSFPDLRKIRAFARGLAGQHFEY